jgi:RNA polymerase sigma-70 factor, ECF subfamily
VAAFEQSFAMTAFHLGHALTFRDAPPPAQASAASTAPSQNGAPAADIERMRQAGQGEPKAQAWLVARVLPPVRRITRAFLRRSADADDAAQLALLAILKSASTYRGEAAVEGWAKRIAVRATMRFIQKERRKDAPLGDDAEGALEISAPAEEPAFESLPRDVRDYLNELPEAQRNAILLHHALGYSIEEIGELTEASPDTVKSRLRLGTAALRKRVQREIAFGRGRSS